MSNNTDTQTIKETLGAIPEPYMGGTLADHGIVSIDKGNPSTVSLKFPYPAKTALEKIREQLDAAIEKLGDIQIKTSVEIGKHTVQGGVDSVPGVKNVIAVSSAKGGVGKSTTAVNIALALAAEGAATGILDADIYGPSVPIMTGAEKKPKTDEQQRIIPPVAHGLQVMSIGLVIDDDSPVAWRGPIVTRALQQLLRDSRWEDLDYLVVDMPPGTGDVQLTLAQKIPVTGAVIVTTPQDLALADARRGLKMFEKVSIPVLGVVENMSVHVCSSCGHREHIFGSGGGAAMCEQYDVELLGELPLSSAIREQADSGAPTMVSAPDSEAASAYRDIAVRVAAKIALKAKDRSSAFPKIVVSNS